MHLWTRVDKQWAALPLEADAYIFDHEAEHAVRHRMNGESIEGKVWLRSGPGEQGEKDWYLLVSGSGSVRTNGCPVVTGIRRLRDRDEIRVNGAHPRRYFFSTESLARVVPLPDSSGLVHCARCRQDVPPGSPIVRCPACGMIHHQSGELECWSYADTCACCSQSTDLETGHLRWTPDSV